MKFSLMITTAAPIALLKDNGCEQKDTDLSVHYKAGPSTYVRNSKKGSQLLSEACQTNLRGELAVKNLVPLPSAMLIDYMHQFMLGVVRTTIYNLVKSSRFFKNCNSKSFASFALLQASFL